MSTIQIQSAPDEADCAYGHLYFFPNDLYVGRSLKEYGEWAQNEVDFLRALIAEGDVVVDAGAFIGTHSVAFSRFVGPKGRVYSFEPHPQSFQILRKNIQENGCDNVHACNVGLSDQAGEMQVEQFELDSPISLGSVQLSSGTAQFDRVKVQVHTLDDVRLEACQLIKVDVEGMEYHVLLGARATLETHRPLVYAECNSADGGWPVIQFMRSLGYATYVHSAEAFNPENFRKNPVNIFGSARELGLLCVPAGRADAFERNLNPQWEVVRVERLDDLVLSLIKKPQYKDDVLSNTTSARQWGNDFWRNETGVTAAEEGHRQNVGHLNQVIAQLAEQSENLSRTVAERDGQIELVLSETQRTDAARQARIADLETQLSESQRDAMAAHAELDQIVGNLNRAVAGLHGQNESLSRAMLMLECDDHIAQVLLEAERVDASRRARIAELDAELARSQHDAVVAQAELRQVYGSKSWRVTSPLRYAGRAGRAVLPPYSPTSRFFRAGRAAFRAIPFPAEMRQRLRSFFLLRAKLFAHAPASGAMQLGSEVPQSMANPLTGEVLGANGRREWSDYYSFKSRLALHAAQVQQSVLVRPPSLVHVAEREVARYAEQLRFDPVEQPRVSIVLPVFGSIALTLECLGSVARARSNVSYEVIVADDASRDATAEVLSRVQGLRVQSNPTNLGFLRNCNAAFPLVRGEYVVLLNNDVQVADGWLDGLLAVFEQYPDAGAVGPKMIYPSGHLQEAGVAFRADGCADMVGLNDDPTRARYNYTRPVDYCSGAVLMLPTALLRELGGFSDEFAPAYCEDADLCLRLAERGYKTYYAGGVTITHHLSHTMAAKGSEGKLAQVSRNLAHLYDKWAERIDKQASVRVIAFYLPQFHTIAENDAWWGEGFTEWTNVRKARPNFLGHDQPREPAELGYYDLDDETVMQKQVELARRYGIDGFCFYYYWFGGKRLLEKPLERLLETGEPAFPFCLCWANENWSRRWDGRDHEILIGQRHSPEDDRAVILDLMRYMQSPHYIRIDGRPLLLVYRVDLFPDFAATAQRWREICRDEGMGEIYLAMVESHDLVHKGIHPSTFGCDASVEFPPLNMADAIAPSGELTNPDFAGGVADYRETAYRFCTRDLPGYKRFRGVMPGWDNTARRQNNSFCFEHATPGVFQAWLESSITQTRQQMYGDERLVFVNAWNEWAEGAYLEPDVRFGHAYLEAVRNAKSAEKLLRADQYRFGE
jgi:FkbM family methyltransferase